MKTAKLLLVLVYCTCAMTAVAQEVRDGKLYDPGITMTGPAKGAPSELAKAAFIIGQWDVHAKRQTQEGTIEASGKAAITFMNRGHGIMLRTVIPGLYGEGSDGYGIGFLSYVPARKSWLFSIYDNYREAIRLYNGDFEGEELVLRTAERIYGATLVYSFRLRISSDNNGGVQLAFDSMTDLDHEWSPSITLNLTKHKPSEDFMPVRDDFGLPAPNRPAEAAQFDFLIGEYNAYNDITRPDGKRSQFNATTTAVYVCGGNAVLEFMWWDTDPSLPDAATSVLRVYNRAMRRWESLYTSNQSNGQLHFGGVKEGDRIVLHPFVTDTSRRMSIWVFHDMREEGYDWFGQDSNDHGATWKKSWIINVRKRK